jgi:hypothetical protein
MVSYNPIASNASSEALFEGHESLSNQDIELQEVRHVPKGHNKNEEEQTLLESFQTDSSDDTDTDAVSLRSDHYKDDGRLSHSNSDPQNAGEVAALHDRINRNLMSVGNSSSASESSAQIVEGSADNDAIGTTTSRIKNLLSYTSLRNNFNFLDRVYKPVPTNRRPEVGSGSDGVFSNLSAKPDLTSNPTESDKPPTYDEVSQDQTPPYWENSVISPEFMDEIFIDGLPVGNIVNFIWNLLVSASFQFVGFILTYLLHTSHAAKQGSRAGLGITFITYGYIMIPKKRASHDSDESLQNYEIQPEQPGDFENLVVSDDKVSGTLDKFTSTLSSGVSAVTQEESKPAHLQLIGIAVIMLGIFIFVKAMMNYRRTKKMEEVILQPPPSNIIPAEELV